MNKLSTGRRALCWAVSVMTYLFVVRNVFVAGMQPDDWRAISNDMIYPIIDSGRWLSHLITNYAAPTLVQATALQLLLAFLLCMWTARTLAALASDRQHIEFATTLIFLGGVSSVYFSDFLQFNEFIFAYVFCIAISVWAFDRSIRESATWLNWLIGLQLLALALAIYPSFVLLGAFVPVVVLMRVDKYSFREAITTIVKAVALSIGGVVLYLVEQGVAELLISSEPTIKRFELINLETAIKKLESLPRVVRGIHSTSLSDTGSQTFRFAFLLTSAGIFCFSMLVTLQFALLGHGIARFIVLCRVLVGLTMTFLVLPVSFWMSYTAPFLPGRTLGFYGFALASTLVVFYSINERSKVRIPGMRHAVVALCGVLTIVGVISSSKIANLRGAASARDSKLAVQITDRINALSDFDGRIVNIIDGVVYNDLSWGRFRPVSSFGPGNEFNAALAPHLKLDRWVAHIPIGPRSCPAFPASGAVYTEDGVAYVCLKNRGQGWNSSRCSPMKNLDGKACIGNDYVAFLGTTCHRSPQGTGTVQLVFRDRSGQVLHTSEALTDFLGTTSIGGYCAFFATSATAYFHEVVVTGLSMDRRELWQEVLAEDRFEIFGLRN